MLGQYRCYYCNLNLFNLKDIIDHCFEHHVHQPLQYREKVLDDKMGTFRFQTKYHQGIIPAVLSKEGKEMVVCDNKTYIRDKTNKRKKLNTPVKDNDSRHKPEPPASSDDKSDDTGREHSNYNIAVSDSAENLTNKRKLMGTPSKDNVRCRQLFSSHPVSKDNGLMDSGRENADSSIWSDNESAVSENLMDANEAENTVESADAELSYLLPDVLRNLLAEGQLDIYLKFNYLLAEKKFPLDNICYLLFVDLVKWFSCSNTSQMRYNDHTIKFWQIGYRIFHGKFLRFMSGLKNFGQILEGESERGVHDPSTSRINFAVPSRNNLYQNSTENRSIFLPGINEESIKVIAEIFRDKPMKIAVDGKKISRGKGKQMGDIDCWGFESEPTLLDRKEQLRKQTGFVEEFHAYIETLEEKGLSNMERIPRAETSKMTEMFKTLVQYICVRNKLLREKLISLEKSELKFRKLGGDDWRQSKYYPVICSIRVNMVDIKKLIEEGLSHSKTTLYLGAALQGNQHLYSQSDIVVMDNQENYMCLNENFKTDDPRFQQQRSDAWFETRKRAAVTGSTLNAALGLSTLKKQKEHFDSAILNIEKPKTDKETQERMNFGNIHEIDAIATIVSRILPFYYPSLKYFEEGCLKVSHERNESFLVVSPDGSFRKEETSVASMMYENKCKAPTSYSPSAYYSIPSYYVTQLLSEMYAYDCKELLFSCWSKQSTTVFHVRFHDELWGKCWKEAIDLYGNDNPRKQTRLSDASKEIKGMLKDFTMNNVTLIAEVPSCTSHSTTEANHSSTSSAYIKPRPFPSNSEFVSLSDVRDNLVSIGKWFNEVYNALRTVASEILVFMLNDLDRSYQFEFNNSHPIAYALKGPSMTVEVLRKMTDTLIRMCEENGLQIAVTASDGQWHNYGIRDVHGHPLTCHQLHRDHWNKIRSNDKASLLSNIRNTYTVASTNDVRMEYITEQYSPLVGCIQEKGRFPRMWNKIVVHGHMNEKPVRLKNWSANGKRPSDDSSNNEENTMNASNMDQGCLVGDFQDDVDEDTLAEIDEVYSGVHTGEVSEKGNQSNLNQSHGMFTYTSSTQDAIQLDALFLSPDENTTRSLNDFNTTNVSHTSNSHLPKDSEDDSFSLSNTLSEAYDTLYGSQRFMEVDSSINETGESHVSLLDEYTFYSESYGVINNEYSNVNMSTVETTCVPTGTVPYATYENNSLITDKENLEIQQITTEQQTDRYSENSSEQNDAAQNVDGRRCDSDALLTRIDYNSMHAFLCTDEKALKIHDWRNLSIEKFSSYFMTKESLKKHFQRYELSCCIAAIADMLNSRKINFNLKWQKYRMVDFFSEIFSHRVSDLNKSNGVLQDVATKPKHGRIQSLKKLCLNFVTKLPKNVLSTIIAEHTWEKTYHEWQHSGPIPNSISIENVQNNIQWFTQPSIGSDDKVRFHFTDACHILTCIRTKLCTTGIAGLKRKAWEEAALSPDTNLNISVVVECVDKQDVALARRMFADDVENAMADNFKEEAYFCRLVRQWFDSEDEPSITATDRCHRRLRLRDWLLQGYEIGRFPPVTQYVRGIPIVTYEALVSHTERKVQLHAFVPDGKYNVRATGSQEVEQFFFNIS